MHLNQLEYQLLPQNTGSFTADLPYVRTSLEYRATPCLTTSLLATTADTSNSINKHTTWLTGQHFNYRVANKKQYQNKVTGWAQLLTLNKKTTNIPSDYEKPKYLSRLPSKGALGRRRSDTKNEPPISRETENPKIPDTTCIMSTRLRSASFRYHLEEKVGSSQLRPESDSSCWGQQSRKKSHWFE